ncbi:MAG: hypothetical protein WCA04_12105 [Geobacteraceae bacterium]
MNNDSVGFPLLSPVVRVMIVLIFCLGATGCSTLKSITSNTDSKQLFKSRDQFVRIVKQDSVKGQKVPANGQPVSLDEGQVRMALRSLEFMTPGKDSSSPVFGDGELDILARYLPQALAQAGPEEDVVFAVIGDYKAVYGLAKEQMFTSGRVFYRDGKLNIIFGDIHAKYWANADRRLYPLTPGSRSKSSVHTWALLPQPDQEFYTGPHGQRTDWVVLDLASMEARAAMGEKAATQAPVVQGAQPYYGAKKTVEERLQILNDLKSKKLITDEEYQQKRLDILKDL